MKKVGLVTYHASHNIGSMLQTYAMQYTLKDRYQLDVDVIDFSSKSQQNMYSMFPIYKTPKGIIRLAVNFLTYPILKSRYNDYENFIKKHFNLSSSSYEYTSQLNNIANDYDYFIAGSDQIWNVNCEDFDDAYFLPFNTNATKISYAPSLGGKNILNSDVDLEKYKSYINGFDYHSVREVNGKQWLEKLSGNNFSIVADPTILVEEDVWDNLANEVDFKGDYIFFYGVPFSPKTYDIVSDISKKLKMPVVMLDAKSYIYRGNFARGFKLWKHCSPSDYLGLIKGSKLVITTSFHGSIFASIFKKNFWAVTFKETNSDDDRIKTLFDQLNLSERLIYIENHDDYDLLDDVDYSSYDETILKFRQRSFSFLDSALKD